MSTEQSNTPRPAVDPRDQSPAMMDRIRKEIAAMPAPQTENRVSEMQRLNGGLVEASFAAQKEKEAAYYRIRSERIELISNALANAMREVDDAAHSIQDWSGTYLGECLSVADDVLAEFEKLKNQQP